MKTANLAIVFTDIKGFTERTSRQTLEENQRLLDAHARLLTPLFQAFGGRIVKSIGDAFLVTFESPTNAVLSGVAIQDRVWLHNREASEAERFDVRVAVNVGEVRLESRDVFGEPVNIAARVEAISEAGEVTFTEAVYLAMNKAEVPAEEMGAFELKGIPGKVTLYRVPHAPYRVEAPSDVASASRPPSDVASPAEALREALPPFGNLGLSRVKNGRAAGAALIGRALDDVRRGPLWRLASPRVLVSIALLGIALVWAVARIVSSPIDDAIDAVEDSAGEERRARVEEAEAVLSAMEDPAERAFHRGRLFEVLARPNEAAQQYRTAASRGHEGAVTRLVDLLDHPRCWVRSDAARHLGELGVKSARGALEELREDGGADDQAGGGVLGSVFGCNSKEAAARALRQLE